MTAPIAPATPIATGPTTAKVKPSGWWVAFAIFLLLAGPGGCSAVLVTKSVGFINGYNRYASFRVPVEDGAVRLRQSADRVGIFLRSANESGGGAVERIEVTSPSGDPVELLTPQDSINAPVPSGGYLSVLRFFHVGETGEYHVRATVGSAARGAELGIGKYDVENLSAWLAGGFAIGGAIFLIGLVMLIVVLVRRSRSKREVRMAGIPPGVPYWGPPGTSSPAPPPPPPGWGAPPAGSPSQYPPTQYPPTENPPTQYPPFPQQPPQPQQPDPPPGWEQPAPPESPPPPEQWAPAPWSAPTEPVPPAPVPPPPSPETLTTATPPAGVPSPPVSAPIPTVRPWQDSAARPAPTPDPSDDDEAEAPDPPA